MVLLVKAIDKYLGTPLCSLLGIFTRKTFLQEPKKILVVQLWGVGETILTLPAIEALRKRFPHARIDILCTERNKAVYAGNKARANVRTISASPWGVLSFIMHNRENYDLVIDMEEYLNVSALISFFVGTYRVGFSHRVRARLYHKTVRYNDKQHAAETFLDLMRSLGAKEKITKLPSLGYSKEDERFVGKILKENGISKGKVICISPGAAESAPSRMWPWERYAALSNKLLYNKKIAIVFTGTSQEKALIEKIINEIAQKSRVVNLAGALSLPQLFCLMKKCSLFIGNDAGAMHIAAAQGIKTIGLFGPNLPVRFGPLGKGNVGIYKGDICKYSPCINVHKGEVPDCLYPKLSQDYQKCMKNIDVEDVMVQAARLLK
jgi:lipopolysaccharide heptosyltransferase II